MEVVLEHQFHTASADDCKAALSGRMETFWAKLDPKGFCKFYQYTVCVNLKGILGSPLISSLGLQLSLHSQFCFERNISEILDS